MTPRVVVDDAAELERAFAAEFEDRVIEAVAARGRCIVALPGGSVATRFFPAIARLDLDWTRVDTFWIDERAVPPDDPESNYGLAARLLLERARVPPDRIHRMRGELPDLEWAAQQASDELRSIAGDPPRLDVALVGVGDDGHVASVFTSGTGLKPCPTPVIAVYDSPKPPSKRLTLTLSVLAGARRVIVAAFGSSKAGVMRDALENRAATTPVAQLLSTAPSSLVLLDREAGQLS